MRCQDLMKREVHCVSPDDTAQEAARRMRDGNIGFLPICDGAHKVVGTLTDRDLALRIVAAGESAGTPVERIMSRDVVSCLATEELDMAHSLMAQHQKSRMVCVDHDGRLAGVISLSDLALYDNGTQATHTLRQVAEREATH